jgi:hypothetical protein
MHLLRATSSVLLALVLGAGCASTFGFQPNGFRGESGAYLVDYLEPSKYRLLPPEWHLDNYDRGYGGRPGDQKKLGMYRDQIEWTLPDGTDRTVELVVHDLKYLHSSGAVLTVRRVPVPYQMRTMKLSAVAEKWANSHNGSVLEFSFNSENRQKAEATMVAKRTASKLVDSQARTVDGHPAREVTFDVVDVDQLQFNQQAPRRRVRALFIHASIEKELSSAYVGKVPAVLVVAYAHDEDKFDSLVPDFENLIGRLHVEK